MPVYWLTDDLIFPPPEGASPEGVVAVGGDTRPERLVLAYSQGIFPWPHEGMPLLWFSPDPRFVLPLDRVRVSRSLRKTIRRQPYEIRVDTAFRRVMQACATAPRRGQDGTWINQQMVQGFCALHELGFAHSVEAWRDGELEGGLYGLSLGRVFCGESMFASEPDASKVATVALCGNLRAWGFAFVDCQVYTAHLARFGAIEWPRRRYLAALRRALSKPARRGRWSFDLDPLQCLEVI
jgi:leucyl/phenylalanyl-tRNA--protein transferase